MLAERCCSRWSSCASLHVFWFLAADALKEEDKFGKRPLTYAVQEKEATFLPFLEADMPLSLNGGRPRRPRRHVDDLRRRRERSRRHPHSCYRPFP